jgi:hypothetical protein
VVSVDRRVDPERRYVPFETTGLAGGDWVPCNNYRLPADNNYRLPADPCHGVVLPVTSEEYERVSTAWT